MSATLPIADSVGEPFPIQRLLPELLALTFSFIKLHPRLHVLSVVCKRWRQAVLRSVTHLSVGRPEQALFIGLFPSLTSLLVKAPLPEASVPTSLVSLHLHNKIPCLCSSYTALTSLTTLVLTVTGRCRCAEQILTRNAASLTECHIWCRGYDSHRDDAHFARHMESARLPKLAMLTMKLGRAIGPFVRFFMAHSAQLTKLYFMWEESIASTAATRAACEEVRVARPSFPKLVRLDAPAPFVAALATPPPALVNLCLRVHAAWDGTLVDTYGGAIDRVQLTLMDRPETFLPLFAHTRLTRLRAIHYEYGMSAESDDAYQTFMCGVVRERFGTQLTSLRVEEDFGAVPGEQLGVWFPCLRGLAIEPQAHRGHCVSLPLLQVLSVKVLEERADSTFLFLAPHLRNSTPRALQTTSLGIFCAV